MVISIPGSSAVVAKPCPFHLLTTASPKTGRFRSWLLFCCLNGAPDQNRTDTSSLEGYGSTIELQAQKAKYSTQKEVFFKGSRNI